MTDVLGGLVALFLVALLVAGVTGRVRMRSCCSIADPAKDLRMPAAYEDGPDAGRNPGPDA